MYYISELTLIQLKIISRRDIMCGIFTLFGSTVDVSSKLLTHRGPNDYRTVTLGKCQMDFYRLAINDLTDAGMQPFVQNKSMLICNGEIYNHKNFRTGEEKGNSDCEVLLPMINKHGIMKTVEKINGDFAMVYTTGDRVIAARDPVGVRPLFYTRYDTNSIAFASEAKALLFLGTEIHVFPPGYVYDSYIDDFMCYYNAYWNVTSGRYLPVKDIKQTLIDAVHTRLDNTERDIGFLLSGGLDSSLIASIASEKLGKIKTFSIGLADSPDLAAARKVAKYLDTDHTEVTFTTDEGISTITDVIKSTETYDTTTIRASTPMWLLCKYIKERTDCRYIFSGEGADELLGGYLYFHKAPGVIEFAHENMRRLKLIHQFDGLRADRCASAHGLDLVVPFLDKQFIDVCMRINQKFKMHTIEKNVLRSLFMGYLPDDILWRRKDGMSDAVGTNWVDTIKTYAEKNVTSKEFRMIVERANGYNIPLTKEEAMYRNIFWQNFGKDNDYLISEIWRPKWTDVTDPSARLLM
jgi:asparagine synthase (glutamine-hydrolysing)